MSISAVVIAKNAQNIIEKNLKSLDFVDELIFVDIKSDDQTIAIAQKFTKKIYQFPSDSRFVEPVRNFALQKATGDWVLVLDADEAIPASLAKKLQELSASQSAEAYYLSRKNMVFGDWIEHAAWWPDYQLRFFKKGSISWTDKIHSQPLYHGKSITKKTAGIAFLEAKEDLAILHHNYQSVEEYLLRLNRYTNIEAEQKTAPKQSISASELLANFSDEWLRRLFEAEGYKDGARGFYLSSMQAIYQMSVAMKIWGQSAYDNALETRDDAQFLVNLKKFQKELAFWISDLEIKEKKGLSKFWAIIKRKINL